MTEVNERNMELNAAGVPKPREGMDYAWFAADSDHPQNAWDAHRRGWRMVLHKESEELGFGKNEFKSHVDGGIYSKQCLLMERPWEMTAKAMDAKIDRADQIRNAMDRKQDSELNMGAETVLAGGPGRSGTRRNTDEDD